MREQARGDNGIVTTAGVEQQPYLHDLVSCVRAPALALSTADGQIRRGGATGAYLHDRRLLDELVLRVDGVEPAAIASGIGAAHEAWFVAVVRTLGDAIADPTVTVERRREVRADGLIELVSLHNRSTLKVRTTVALKCGGDLAPMSVVKRGHQTSRSTIHDHPTGVSWGESTRVDVVADPPPHAHESGGVLRWELVVPAGASWQVALSVSATQQAAPTFGAPTAGSPVRRLTMDAGDRRLSRLVDRGLADIDGLLLADPLAPHDVFVSAGSPWFLTLFGRDSLWAARFLLPVGTDLAASTLRTLARRQGSARAPERDEEPGKILHEVRPAELGAALSFAPVYYGTVDATPLWVNLLADAWRWGMPVDEVEALLPNLERALAWMRDDGDSDGDGFLEYVPHTSHGLSNQGWKDSHDSVQWRDGALARSPIALCEVQGYAHEAAVNGADLLDAFGRPGADEWREWAARLSKRFREAFWVESGGERYPAIALDRDKRRVDTVSSNIGHLLATGILDDEESATVAARLSQADMDSGWGLRTMTAQSPRFNALSYHGGSVWPHDTAITILGLALTGHDELAANLARGLVAAAEKFDFRLPELFGGQPRDGGVGPTPYPAACRPQAWAAAAALGVLSSALGLRPDAPAGQLVVRPMRSAPFGALDVDGLVVAGSPIRVRCGAAAPPTVTGLPTGIRLVS